MNRPLLRARIHVMAAVSAMVILAFILASCSPAGPGRAPEPTGQSPQASITATITIAGSTSVQPLSERLAEAFMSKHKDIKINVQGGGSTAGITAARTGTAQIGSSSRELKPDEKGLHEVLIAKDGIAIIVNSKNPIQDLKFDDVKAIFSGKVKDWNQVGGKPGPITVVIRESGSGTRGAFEEMVMKGEPFEPKAVVQNSTGAVRSTVAGDPNAIGFVSLAGLGEGVKAVKIDGIEPTAQNVVNGTYKINRPFLYLTKSAPEGAVKQFIDFALSAEGQEIVAKEHLVRVK